MSFTVKNNYQWQLSNSGIKHLNSEECEHLQISSRPNTQYQTTLPQNSHKAHCTTTWRKIELNGPVEPVFWDICVTHTHVFEI